MSPAERARRLFLSAATWDPSSDREKTTDSGVPPKFQGIGGEPSTWPWEDAAAIARRVGQESVFDRFAKEHCPPGALSQETKADLESHRKLHALRWSEIEEFADQVLDRLLVGSGPVLLLKGIAFAGELYDPPWLRPMRDIDILLDRRSAEAARSLLLETGIAVEGREASTLEEGHHHLEPVFARASGVCLEIHTDHLGLPRGFEDPPSVEFFREGARPSRIFAGKAFVPSAEAQVLSTCLHLTHGDAIGRRAQNLVDLARAIARDAAKLDWDRLRALAQGRDLARSLALPLLYLAREGFPSAPDAFLAFVRSRAGWSRFELRILFGLIDRYRIGSPPAWPLVSGRISNILWRRTISRGSRIARMFAAAAECVFARRKRGRTGAGR